MAQAVITDKPAFYRRINGLVDRHIRSHIIRHFPGLSRRLALYLHRLAESLFICCKALFFQNFNGQIHRESIGIVKLEGIFSRENGLAFFLHFFHHITENIQSLIDGLIEIFFLSHDQF